MNFKKVLAISVALAVMSLSLGAVCAGSYEIDLGNMLSSNVQINGVETGAALPSTATGSSSHVQLKKVNYTADMEIDISKMKNEDKELLKKAIGDDNTTITMNMTADHAISVTLYQGFDISISGDRLKIDATGTYQSPNEPGSMQILSVDINNHDNVFSSSKMS